MKTDAAAGDGIAELLQAVEAHRQHLRAHPAQLQARRRAQARARLIECISQVLRMRQEAAHPHDRFEVMLDEVVARRCDPQTAALRLLDALAP